MSTVEEKARKFIGAAGTLGSGTVLKAIGKFIPGIGNFVSGAFTAGYAADQILDFVKDKLETPAARRNRQQLESRSEQGVARPDENASLSQMEQQRSPLDALGGIAKLGGQAAGGVLTARAGAEQQAKEQDMKEQELQLNQKKQQQSQQVQEKSDQRQTQQDQLDAIRRQDEALSRKQDMEFKKRAEERAIERHKASMNKPLVKSAMKKKIPQDYGDALAEVDELINRL